MNFYARSTVTARLPTPQLTRIPGPSAPRSARTLPPGSSFRWLRCTSARAPRRRGGWVRAGVPGDAVDEEDGGGGAVEGFDDGAEALLACGVPDLHLDACLRVQPDLLGVELDPKGGRVALPELVLGESVQQAALPHARRTDYDHLEGLLVLLPHPYIV